MIYDYEDQEGYVSGGIMEAEHGDVHLYFVGYVGYQE